MIEGDIMNNLELEKMANEIRKDIVTAVHSAKSGHPGGSLSSADIFTYLYFEEMNVDPAESKVYRAYMVIGCLYCGSCLHIV
jgi:transketolase